MQVRLIKARNAICCLLVALVLGSTGATTEVHADEPVLSSTAPVSLSSAHARLETLRAQLNALVVEAKREPEERLLKVYEKYTGEELQKRRRNVCAEDLASWLEKSNLSDVFRAQVKDALKKGARMRGDPDMSNDVKRGSGTNRGHFFARHVVPILSSDDRDARELAAALLNELFGVPRRGFHYDTDAKATWSPSQAAWRKHLRKK